jgi:glycosyltransferase involved in cell wall biosynthesis
VVVLGRVDRARRPLAVLRAAAALADDGRELELVFAGRPGDAAGELRAALAAARFPARWLVSPPEAELPPLVGGAAALVQLEREAFTAVTPLEALAVGAAVVATRLPAFREVLGDEAEWVALEDGEPELAAALARALDSASDPAARARRAALAAGHTWERTARLTAAAWGRILERA